MTDSNGSGKKMLVLVISIVMGLSAVSLLVGASDAGSSPAVPKEIAQYTLPAGQYHVNFTESGLPSGTYWYVYLYTGPNYNQFYDSNYTYNSTNQFNVTNNSYEFYVYYSSSYSYSASPFYGTLVVNGNNVFVNVAFTNTSTPAVQTYHHYFNITNLPSVMNGITWTWRATLTAINVNGGPYTSPSSHTASINLSGIPSGTYSYSFTTPSGTELTPSSGTVSISSNTTTFLSFSYIKTYEVNFVELGLASGQTFSAELFNNTVTYVNTSLVGYGYTGFYVPDGTYYYSVYNYPSVYTAVPSYGTITVNGSSVTVSVAFTIESTYSASFKVVNLPTNIPYGEWSFTVNLNGNGNTYSVTSHSASAKITDLQNGSYYYTVSNSGTGTPPVGSSLSPAIGTFSINGTSKLINLTLLPPYPTYYANFTITSYPSSVSIYGLNWEIEITNSTGYYYNPSPDTFELSVSGLRAGTYTYYLYSDYPFAFKSTHGTFTITNSSVNISLSLVTTTFYIVTYTETGLLPGTTWGVAYDSGFVYNDSFTGSPMGYTQQVSVPIQDYLPNGTYYLQAFVYYNGKYYFQQPVKVVVNGKEVTQSFTFTTSTSNAGSASLTTALIYSGVAVGGAVIGGLVAYALVRRRRLPPAS